MGRTCATSYGRGNCIVSGPASERIKHVHRPSQFEDKRGKSYEIKNWDNSRSGGVPLYGDASKGSYSQYRRRRQAVLRPWSGLLGGSTLLCLGSRPLGLAAPSPGLDSRLLQGAINSVAVDSKGPAFRKSAGPEFCTWTAKKVSCAVGLTQCG